MVLSTEHKQLCVQGFIRWGGVNPGEALQRPLPPNLVTCFVNWYKYDVYYSRKSLNTLGAEGVQMTEVHVCVSIMYDEGIHYDVNPHDATVGELELQC